MKAVVLSSGGIDSTTCLGMAVKAFGVDSVTALSVRYGQRHARELQSARAVAEYYGVPHKEVDLSPVFASCECPLLAESKRAVPHGSYAEQQNGNKGVVQTYVPFRNGLMLSAAASVAMGIYPGEDVLLYIGAHADDAAGDAYPDCSEAFVESMRKAIELGSYNKTSIAAPLVNMAKKDVVREGLALSVPYHLTWSCYEGGEKPCGKCGTCIDRAKAFEANGVEDPAL